MRSKRSARSASTASSRLHRVDQYAADVVAGQIVAGPLVRLACERHQRDRQCEDTPDFQYHFDQARADYVLAFYETVLHLPDVLDEDGYPAPFILQPWQAFIVGSLFGWVDGRGLRRFREAYIEIGKGNGKTPLCAGIGLFGLMEDGERAAEIYAAAADQEQAQILFRDAVRIVEASPDIAALLKTSGGEHIWKLDHKPSLSFFRTFSRESGAKSGPRPHMALLDELHEHGTPQISIKIRAGAKRRLQPLFVEITNSGFDRSSICWEHHEHSRKVVEQAVSDEKWFAFVCGLDVGDDPLTDESCWPKANPNYGISVTEDYLRRQVENARNMPAEANYVLRLNFCIWTQADTKAIDMRLWESCPPMPSNAELVSARCFGGIDLGMTDDFSAWARLYALDDGRVAIKMRYWLPESALTKYPDRPYGVWRNAQILTVTGGDATDYRTIEDRIAKDCSAEGVRQVGYDKRFAEQMAQNLMGHNVDMVNTPQGWALNEALRKLLELVITQKLCHGNDPILTWMAANLVVLSERKGELIRIAKERAGEKIDGLSAVTTALDRLIHQRPEPAYQMLFIGGRR